MKSATPGPSKQIWLHLLEKGEWMKSRQIRASLPELDSTNAFLLVRQIEELLKRAEVATKGRP